MEKKIKEDTGAITVFLAITLMSLLTFAGLLIDIARITAADNKAQAALNTAIRSALAKYDPRLAGGYELYAFDAENDLVKEDIVKYLDANLKERHKGISFIKYKIEPAKITVETAGSLLGDKQYKQQILEYMKYKVPVLYTESIATQFMNTKLAKRVEFSKSDKIARVKAKELRIKITELNKKLDGIRNKIRTVAADELEDLKEELQEASGLDSEIFNPSGSGILSQYRTSINSTNDIARQGECSMEASREFDSVGTDATVCGTTIQSLLGDVDNSLKVIKPLMEEIRELEDKIDSIKAKISRLEREIKSLKEQEPVPEDQIASKKEKINELKEELEPLQEKKDELQKKVDDEMAVLKGKLKGKTLVNLTTSPEKTKVPHSDKIGDFNKKIEEIKKSLLVNTIAKDWLISSGEFENAAASDDAFMKEMSSLKTPYDNMGEDLAEEENDNVLEYLEDLLQAADTAAADGRDKLYVIEYVMDKYTFLTSKTQRGHYFEKGEVEYILCGSDSGEAYAPAQNTEAVVIAAALERVWFLRFAIDTVDEFAASKMPFPPQRLAWALAEGFIDSCNDMFSMLNGEAIAICPNFGHGITVRYSDHLRLLLLLKSEDEILRKSRQLLQVNMINQENADGGEAGAKFKLSSCNTIIKAEADIKINLIFLPMLGMDRIAGSRFQDGSYIIHKEACLSY